MRWLLFVLTLTLTVPAYSQDRDAQRCPSWVTPDMPITESTFQFWSKAQNKPVGVGPRLDALMYHWNRGILFHVPYGYFNPWSMSSIDQDVQLPTLDKYLSNLARNSDNTGYDASTGLFNSDLLKREDVLSPTISFWMPSLRYVEQNMQTAYKYQPCEPGREPATENQYVVRFRIEWPGTQNIEQSPHMKRFENAQLRPLSNPNSFKRFADDYYVNLRCTFGRGCDGWIWDRDRNYILYIILPEFLRQKDSQDFWKNPTNAAIQLLESWKLKQE